MFWDYARNSCSQFRLSISGFLTADDYKEDIFLWVKINIKFFYSQYENMNWLLGLCFTHFQDTPSFKGYVSILCTFRILFYWIVTLDLTTLRIIFHWIVTLVSCATSGFFFNRYLRWYLGNLKDFLSEIVI